jgi:hypothetical protein
MLLTIQAKTRKHLGTGNLIDRVQGILSSLVPDYLDRILLQGDESFEERVELELAERGALARCVEKELARSSIGRNRWKVVLEAMGTKFPVERRLGGVFFIKHDESKEVHFDFDELRLAPNGDAFQFGNHLCIKSDEPEYSGHKLAERTLSAAIRIFDNDIFDHGYCCLDDQYDVKNLDRTGGGVQAVGLDASKCLPGFYWGNYFGAFLRDLIGRERLLTTPGCRSQPLGAGVLVVNELPPDQWSESQFLKNENKAMDHIGRHLFFEKGKICTGKLFS